MSAPCILGWAISAAARGTGVVTLSSLCCSLQNVIPLNEGEVDTPQDTETQLQEQEKRIEISCTLATEASRRGRMLSGKALRRQRAAVSWFKKRHGRCHGCLSQAGANQRERGC